MKWDTHTRHNHHSYNTNSSAESNYSSLSYSNIYTYDNHMDNTFVTVASDADAIPLSDPPSEIIWALSSDARHDNECYSEGLSNSSSPTSSKSYPSPSDELGFFTRERSRPPSSLSLSQQMYHKSPKRSQCQQRSNSQTQSSESLRQRRTQNQMLHAPMVFVKNGVLIPSHVSFAEFNRSSIFPGPPKQIELFRP